ncbi:uncharacterized protein LOC122083664 [Macadamia integrifolia]|uniref:uncharacterized protein LOC122083664 n=1 Tax=Macadamia integrifolia TaxID=60698 RepID=UPI001C4E2EAD|nr:uncharacterized protein LOC122083664 [Macadamia integrifolia]
MNPLSPSPRRLDFNEKQNSKGGEEKRISGNLFSQSSVTRGNHDHDWIQKYSVADKDKDMVMGLVLSQGRTYLDLMQNCDLPPPVKVFAGAERPTLTTTKISKKDEDDVFPMGPGSLQYDEKLDLLKALQLSQTRAREAEKKATLVIKERESLSNALLEESLRLFAHRQWVRLLELEVLLLQSQKKKCEQQQLYHGRYQPEKRRKIQIKKEDDTGGWTSWFMALALCLGFAGLGVIFGRR